MLLIICSIKAYESVIFKNLKEHTSRDNNIKIGALEV